MKGLIIVFLALSLGFSCHREKLYAFVSVVPQSLGDVLRKSFRNPAKWKARYQVDDDPERFIKECGLTPASFDSIAT